MLWDFMGFHGILWDLPMKDDDFPQLSWYTMGNDGMIWTAISGRWLWRVNDGKYTMENIATIAPANKMIPWKNQGITNIHNDQR